MGSPQKSRQFKRRFSRVTSERKSKQILVSIYSPCKTFRSFHGIKQPNCHDEGNRVTFPVQSPHAKYLHAALHTWRKLCHHGGEGHNLMKMEGFAVNYVEPAPGETEPLLRREISTYLKFRLGREKQNTEKFTKFALTVFKVCFCSVGLWGHHAWNYIPRVFLGLVCFYQVCFVLYFDVLDKCHMNYGNITDAEKLQMEHSAYIEHIDDAILNIASVVSFLVFVGCFTLAKRKESALVSPSLSLMENIDRKITIMLFVSFLIATSLLASSVGLIYKTSLEIQLAEGLFCKHVVGMAIAAQFILHWVSLNICHIFASSSLALGEFSIQTYYVKKTKLIFGSKICDSYWSEWSGVQFRE